MENTNSTNKRNDLLLTNKPRIVPWGTERMLQRIPWHSRITLHRSAHPEWEQDQTEKHSYGLDWQQKSIWHGATKLDNKLPQNVQNITWSHKLLPYEKTMKTWRVELTAGRRNVAEIKIQRGIFQGDALSPLQFIIGMTPENHIIRKRTARYKLSRSQEKINHLMYMDDIKLFAKKWKRTRHSHTRR